MLQKTALRAVFLLLAAVFLFSAGACRSKEKQEGDNGEEPTYSIPTELDLDLSSLITREEASDTLGVSLQDGKLFNANTSIRYAAEDMLSYVEIDMMSGDRAMYDAVISNYDDAVNAPNLGDTASWSAQAGQLLLLKDSCLLSFTVVAPDKNANALLMAARQLAAIAVEKL